MLMMLMMADISLTQKKLPSLEEIHKNYREAKSYVKTAIKLQEMGYLEEVENCFFKATEIYNETVEQLLSALNSSKLVQLSSQKISSPLEAMRQAEQDRKEAARLLEEGKNLEEAGKLDEAINCYYRASELYPNLPWTYYSLGDALRKKGKLNEAIIFYCECIKISPETPWSYHALGDILYQQQKLDKAMAFYEWALRIKPNLYWTHNALGGLCEHLKKWEKAEHHYRHAVEIEPSFEQAKNGLNRVLKHKI